MTFLKELGSFGDIASKLGYSDETIRNWYYYRAIIGSDAISRILKEYNVEVIKVSLSQAKIEIVVNDISSETMELLHKKLIRKER